MPASAWEGARLRALTSWGGNVGWVLSSAFVPADLVWMQDEELWQERNAVGAYRDVVDCWLWLQLQCQTSEEGKKTPKMEGKSSPVMRWRKVTCPMASLKVPTAAALLSEHNTSLCTSLCTSSVDGCQHFQWVLPCSPSEGSEPMLSVWLQVRPNGN